MALVGVPWPASVSDGKCGSDSELSCPMRQDR